MCCRTLSSPLEGSQFPFHHLDLRDLAALVTAGVVRCPEAAVSFSHKLEGRLLSWAQYADLGTIYLGGYRRGSVLRVSCLFVTVESCCHLM